MNISKTLLAIFDLHNQPLQIIVRGVLERDIPTLIGYGLDESKIEGQNAFVGSLTQKEIQELSERLNDISVIDFVPAVPRSQH